MAKAQSWITYEWDIETVSVDDDGAIEIIDHNHRDRLRDFKKDDLTSAINQDPADQDGTMTRLVLVRDDDKLGGCRAWAYVKGGKLQEVFRDAYDNVVCPVPKRFIAEFAR